LRRAAVTVGTFDGVHVGHRSLVRHTARIAEQRGLDAIAVTFWPRPDTVLAPERALPDLCQLDARLRRLREAGALDVVVVPFTPALACVSAATFVAALMEELDAAVLCVGEEFALGRGREGNVAAIRAMGVEVITPPLVLAADGRKVSSSELRRVDVATRRDAG